LITNTVSEIPRIFRPRCDRCNMAVMLKGKVRSNGGWQMLLEVRMRLAIWLWKTLHILNMIVYCSR